MRLDISRLVLVGGLVPFLIASALPPRPRDGGAADVRVTSVMVKTSRKMVRLRLKIVNNSNKPVYLAGSNFQRPRAEAVFLEEWRGESGWKALAPCLDVPPGDVVKLEPGRTLASGYDLNVIPPRRSVCEAPNLQSGGRFRYLVVYFMSEKEARDYAERVDSPSLRPPGARVAVSDAFQILPPK